MTAKFPFQPLERVLIKSGAKMAISGWLRTEGGSEASPAYLFSALNPAQGGHENTTGLRVLNRISLQWLFNMLFCVTFYNIDHEHPRISRSVPLTFMFILMPTPDDLDHCTFIVSLKAVSVNSPTLFFFKILFLTILFLLFMSM